MAHKILLIEDNHDIARLVELHLADLSFEVEVAGNGRTGLELALGGNHSLVILDIMLPELDGLEVCRQLRSASNQVPILMLTARSSELDRVLGYEANYAGTSFARKLPATQGRTPCPSK